MLMYGPLTCDRLAPLAFIFMNPSTPQVDGHMLASQRHTGNMSYSGQMRPDKKRNTRDVATQRMKTDSRSVTTD